MPSLTDVYISVRGEVDESRFRRDIEQGIRRPLLDASRKAGKDAGRAAAEEFARGAAERANKISEKIAKARDAEADAAGRVRIAEQRLAETRDSGKAKASQILAAEEGLARARRSLTSATTQQSSAARRLSVEEESTSRKLRDMAMGAKQADSFFGRLGSSVQRFSRDASGGLTELAHSGRNLSSVFRLISFPVVIGGAIALGGAATALASSIGLASTSLAALAPALVGAGVAVGTTVAMFAGAAGALKQYFAAQKAGITQAGTAAAKEVSAASSIRSAQNRLADARRSQGQAAERAADTVRRAEESLADAQRGARRAQEDLTDARHEAFLEIERVAESVRDLALDQEGAQIAVARAQERLNEVNKDAASNALDRREAAFDLKRAQQNVLDIEEDLGRATQENNRLSKEGVRGTDVYKEALDRQATAQRDVKEAEADLTRARKEAQQIQADAARAVVEASLAVSEATKKASASTTQASSAALLYADAMKKLTPEGRTFVRQLISMNPLLKQLQATAERRGLSGFTALLRDSVGLFPAVNRGVGSFAASMGTTARALGNLSESPAFRRNLGVVLDSMGRAFATMGKAVVPLVSGFFTLSAATSPLVERFATFVTKQAILLGQWLTAKQRTGELARFFRNAGDEMSKWGGIVANFGIGLLGVFVTANKPGRSLADSLLAVSKSFREWVASSEGSTKLRAFFQFFADFDYGRLWQTARAVAQMAAVYASLKGIGLLAKNPFFFLLQLAAVRDPDMVSRMVGNLWRAAEPLMTFLSDHPNVFAGILAFMAVTKIGAGIAALAPLLNAVAIGTRAVGVALAFVAANPIVLVIAGLVALGIGLFVLYKKSETFRDIVNAAFRAVAAVGTWLWRSVLVPAFHGIQAVIQVVWPIIRGIFQTWVAFVRNVLGPTVSWLWRNVIVPVFNGIKATISTVWQKGIKPVFSAIGGFIERYVAPAFSRGVTAIGRAWDRIKAIAAVPVNFVIDTVLNKGIFKAYNWIVSKFGGTKIPRLPLIGRGDVAPQSRSRNGSAAGLARGGVVPFITDGPRAIVGEGDPRYPEYVIPTDPRYRKRAVGLYRQLGTQMLDAGGVIGAGFKAGLKRAASIVTANADNDPMKWLSQKISAALGVVGQSPFARTAMGIPRRIGQILLAQAKGLLTGGGGGTFAAGLKGVVNFARSQVGDPYVWGGVGPNGYDCSGFVSNLVEVAKGLPLYRRLFATGSMGGYPWPNHYNGAFRVGWTANAGGGIGHTAATVNGVNMESRGGDGVVVGARSRGANQAIFDRHAFLARGGILRSWVTGGDGSRAKMLRAHINRGGTFFEDFSFRGMSPFYRRGNDRLANHFWAGHPGFDFGERGSRRAIGGWLNRVISDAIRGIQARRLASGGLIPGMPGDPPFDVLDRRGKYYQPGLLDAVREAKVADRGGLLLPGQAAVNASSRPEMLRSAPEEDALLAELRGLRADLARMPTGVGREVGVTLAKFGTGGRR